VFVVGKTLKPSVMFASNAGAYPKWERLTQVGYGLICKH